MQPIGANLQSSCPLGHSGEQRKFVYSLLSPAFLLSFRHAQPPNLCLCSSLCLNVPSFSPSSLPCKPPPPAPAPFNTQRIRHLLQEAVVIGGRPAEATPDPSEGM